ncbi:MAG: discoidin domain-containing protein [Bryobacteraceae bacterium]|nr:discoidin domain-containing protein [Bryobacteraceae bacterium]
MTPDAENLLEVDRLVVGAVPVVNRQSTAGWTLTVRVSDDGQSWKQVGAVSQSTPPQRNFNETVRLGSPVAARFYRVEFDSAAVNAWRAGDIDFFLRDRRVEAGGPHDFTSAWMPASNGEEWVYVDLGGVFDFDLVRLSWIRRPDSAKVQVSNDAKSWMDLAEAAGDEVKTKGRGRYVRVLTGASKQAPILGEIEVMGRGGFVAQPKPMAAADADGRLRLAGGAWKVERDSRVSAGGGELSKPGFNDTDWVAATVPGTTLTSYYNAGALPDPNFGGNQMMISDSFFYADFWYRTEFTAPAAAANARKWLKFDGINWKAEVWLNGGKLGRIEGGFMRGSFDVTRLLKPRGRNALAVRIEKNATPGTVREKTYQHPDKNGGALGADNPTFHASIGWDWIPTIRGRNTGIWNDVWLTATGSVTVEDPFVQTKLPLPDTSSANVEIEVTLRNHEPRPAEGTLRGRFGDAVFQQKIALEASSAKTVKIETIKLRDSKLWWPVGYGEPNLYPVDIRFEAGGTVSDSRSFLAGIRQFAYSEDGGALRMWINGRRFIPRGGNWGFSESMLRYRGREYDTAVRYHRDMNFTMIRNWVGQIGEDELYEACDRHGVVLWQDFWLANPVDGPNPDDHALFLSNARDTILRIRNHASVGLYCGRNEGYPPKPLDDGIRRLLAELHPGLHYISSSADDVVSGHGPYRAMPVKHYFEQRATPKFHSEMGMPNPVTFESLRQMMPEDAFWPQGAVWGLHDFCLNGAQGGASFIERLDKSYGGAKSAEEWLTLAQFINYEGYRAMFEAQSKNRMGLLIWMSHPAWPSFVWQTYDYYFEPTAAYFAAKKASEPLHIQWNPLNDTVEVVNYSAGQKTGLRAKAEILNMDGSRQWEKSAILDSAEDTVGAPVTLEWPAAVTPVHFIRLTLSEGQRVLSENFYWRGVTDGDFIALRQLPVVELDARVKASKAGGKWVLAVELQNSSKTPALMVRLKPVRSRAGDRILPALFSENYFALMPGESKSVRIEMNETDCRGESPRLEIGGFNARASHSK